MTDVQATTPPMNSGKKATPRVGMVTLSDICKEVKIDGVSARARLRAAVEKGTLKHKKGEAWTWKKGDAALKEVRTLLKE